MLTSENIHCVISLECAIYNLKQISNDVLYCITQTHENLIGIWVFTFFGIYPNQVLVIFIFHSREEVSVILQPAFHYRVSVLLLMNESVQGFLWDFITQKVEVAPFHRIEATLLDLLVDSRIALVESDNKRRNDARLIQKLYLLWSGRATIENPTVHAAVWLVESLFHQADDEIIRDYN